MAVREEGEFELILGNRQLLSVLFIVVVLLGVFFAMGFLAGRSTSGATAIAKNEPDAEAPRVVEPPQSPARLPESSKPVEQPPAASTELPAPKAAQVDSLPTPAAVPASKPVTSSGYVEAPPTGTYLQAAATRREDAESMLGLLKQDGLRGYVTPSPKAEMFRVLIGPLPDNESVVSAREKLSNRGIKTPYIVKY